MVRTKKSGGSAPDGIPSESVQVAAYYLWEKRGRPVGDDWTDWLEAEKKTNDWVSPAGILRLKSRAKKSNRSETKKGKLYAIRKLARVK